METPAGFDALIAQGLAASQEGRAQAAMDLFAQARACDPASGIPHFLIGSEHAAAGEVEAAEAAFANAVLLAPEFALARYQLGLLQFSAGRAAVALVTWEPLHRRPPSDPLAHFVRGFAALAEDRLDTAIAHFRTGLACPEANPGVAADVRRVMDSVEALARAGAPAQEGPEAAHVLLGAYSGGIH